MPTIRTRAGFEVYYALDDFTDPWTTPETVLMVHGLAADSREWTAWVPKLAREYRVLRPDLLGFGRSAVPPEEFEWSLSSYAGNLKELLDQLRVERVHLAGTRIGGSVAMRFAADYPERVDRLVIVGGPAKLGEGQADPQAWVRQIKEEGVLAWARATMDKRLGDVNPAMREWWIRLMGGTPRHVLLGMLDHVAAMDLTGILPRIKAPTLMITSDGSALASLGTVKRWAALIPNAELLVLAGNSYNVTVSRAEECAAAALEFLRRSG